MSYLHEIEELKTLSDEELKQIARGTTKGKFQQNSGFPDGPMGSSWAQPAREILRKRGILI